MKFKFTSFLVVLLLLASVPATFAQTDSGSDNTITVTGTGTATSQPDMATLVVGVEQSGSDILTVYRDVNTAIAGVVEALESMGIADADMRTTGLDVYVNPIFMGEGMPPQNESRISNRINITIRDLSQIEAVIDTAINSGANVIYGLEFGIEDTSALESEARSMALANARARADEIASNLGVEIGSVTSVVEFSGSVPQQLRNNAMMSSGGAGNAVVEPGRISVSVATEVTFRFAE